MSKLKPPETEVEQEVLDLSGLKVKRKSTLPFKRLLLVALALILIPTAGVIMFHHPAVSVTSGQTTTTPTTPPTKPTVQSATNTALCLSSRTINIVGLNVSVAAPY